MEKPSLNIKQIGIIKSPFNELAGMPIQPKGAVGVEGTVIVNTEYQSGLKDLEGFSHLYLIYLFHKANRIELSVKPFMDNTHRGVYATRSPLRPNHIGLSIVELVSIQENKITIRGVDILNNTPLLDIKPYIHNFDSVEVSKSGWMTKSEGEVKGSRSDSRFT